MGAVGRAPKVTLRLGTIELPLRSTGLIATGDRGQGGKSEEALWS